MLLLSIAACAWEAPLDPDAEAPRNQIAGAVVVDGLAPEELGPAIVLVYDAADPGPPFGTGAPVTFATVPPDAFTGDGAGVQSASYTVGDLEDGTWLVTALIDRDGDFQPLLTATAGASCGDWIGGHIADIASGTLAPVTIAGGERKDDVTVAVAVEIPLARPAFAPSVTTLSRDDAAAAPTVPQVVGLVSTGVHSSVLEIADPGAPCGAIFPVLAVDADADGVVDPHPDVPGAYDVWPRVYLSYLGVPQADGSLADAPVDGESWGSVLVPDPTAALTGELPLNQIVPNAALTTFWAPFAVHTLPDGTEEVVTDPTALPAGAWGITVVSSTGQTWTVPNELYALPTVDGWDASSQASVIVVQ